MIKNGIKSGKEHGFEQLPPLFLGYLSNSYVGTSDSGLRFTVATEEAPGKEIEIMTIPDVELPDFITTLIRHNGGRTSPHSLRKILTAILESL
jgi:hypothetical protein